MRKPISIRIGRDESNPDLLIMAWPIGEPEKEWGQYDVAYFYRTSKDNEKARGMTMVTVSNFPRALGTDGLAAFLLDGWMRGARATSGTDCEQGGDFPRMPTDEERAARPLTVKACDGTVLVMKQEQQA